jgi:hypothetical protein
MRRSGTADSIRERGCFSRFFFALRATVTSWSPASGASSLPAKRLQHDSGDHRPLTDRESL